MFAGVSSGETHDVEPVVEVNLGPDAEGDHASEGGHDFVVMLDADTELENAYEEEVSPDRWTQSSERELLDGGAVEFTPFDFGEREK